MARKEHELELALRKLSLIYTVRITLLYYWAMESPRVSGITDVTPTQVDGWYYETLRGVHNA